MTRNFRNFIWFLVGCIVAAVPLLSMAETIPATYGKEQRPLHYRNQNSSQCSVHQSVSALCSSVGYTEIELQGTPFCKPPSGSGGFYVYACCPNNYTNKGSYCESSSNAYFCPSGQNWTLSGQTCMRPDCAPGETRQSDGTCLPPACPPGESMLNDRCVSDTCPDGSPRSLGGLCRGQACTNVYGPTAPPGPDYGYSQVCTYQGCKLTTWSNGTTTVAQGTSGECSPQENNDPLPCPAGETKQTIGSTTKCYPTDNATCGGRGLCSGSVNGVVVCTSCGPGTTTSRTEGGTTTRTDTPAGGGESTTESKTTETTTSVNGGQITTTTTTTNEDGSTTEETKTQSRSEYCKDKPNDPLCKTNDQDDYCKQNPQSLSCVKLGEPAAADPIKTESRGIAQIVPGASASGSCPSNVALPHGAEFDYGPMCSFATSIRPLVLGLGWLIGGLMIFAWFKS